MRSTLVNGETLRRLRVERLLSCAELSRRSGVALSFVKYLEAGKRGGSDITALKLATALDVHPDALRAAPTAAGAGKAAA